MRADGIVAQELLGYPGHLNPGHFVDVDSVPSPLIARAGDLSPDLVIDPDNLSHIHRISNQPSPNPPLVIDPDLFYTHIITALSPVQMLLPDWFMGAAEAFYSPTIAMSGPGYTFDTATAVATTLTNANLTATHASNVNNSGVKGIAFYTAGRYYHEVTIGATHGNADGVGIAGPGATYTQVAGSSGAAIVITFSAGTIGTSGRSFGPIAVGDVIGIASDVAGLKIFFRKNGGSWNGDPTANPTTGVGGIAMPTNSSWAPAVVFAGGGRQAGDNVTANFGALTYGAAAPSGFVNWPTGVMLLAPNVPDADVFFTATIATTTTVLTAAHFIDLEVFVSSAGKTQSFSAARAGRESVIAFNSRPGGKTQAIAGVGVVAFPVLGVAQVTQPSSIPRLQPGAYVDVDSFATASITRASGLSPSLFNDGDTLHAPIITYAQLVTAALVTDTDALFAPSLAAIATLVPALFNDTDVFRAPSILGQQLDLGPGLVTDADTIFAPSAVSVSPLVPALFGDTDAFYSPVIGAAAIIAPTATYSDSDSFAVPTVQAIPYKVRAIASARAGRESIVVRDTLSGKTQVLADVGTVT